jgi:hypothetical protein
MCPVFFYKRTGKMWAFLFFAAVAAMMIVVGNYERRIAAMEKNPRERVRIVPRSTYDDQMGMDWVSST